MSDLSSRRGLRYVALAVGALLVLPILSTVPAVAASGSAGSARAASTRALPVAQLLPITQLERLRLAANKRLVLRYYDEVFNKGNIAYADLVVRRDYIQHNPNSPDGIDALKQGAAQLRAIYPQGHFTFYQISIWARSQVAAAIPSRSPTCLFATSRFSCKRAARLGVDDYVHESVKLAMHREEARHDAVAAAGERPTWVVSARRGHRLHRPGARPRD